MNKIFTLGLFLLAGNAFAGQIVDGPITLRNVPICGGAFGSTTSIWTASVDGSQITPVSVSDKDTAEDLESLDTTKMFTCSAKGFVNPATALDFSSGCVPRVNMSGTVQIFKLKMNTCTEL